MLFSFFKVSGHSMEPKIRNGSFFIASSIPFIFSQPKKGDPVLFEEMGKTIVKKIVKIEKGKYFVEGENKVDSMKFEPITRKEIIGKLLIKF